MKDKIYVITGATSGIGNAILKALAKENKVFAGYRNPEKVSELKEISENVIPFYIDMENSDSIEQAVDFIKSNTDRIDALINVAGCVVAGAIEEINISDVKRQFQVNTFSHLEFSKGLFSILDNGKIINISSMASFGIFPFISPYCASKRALDILFNSMFLETKRNVKIISIKPGVIATPLWEKSVEENSKNIENCTIHEKEMRFLKKNALRNATKGLPVEAVVKTVLKADSSNNPKSSYLVGSDAFIASLVSYIPQGILNKLIKFFLNIRLSK